MPDSFPQLYVNKIVTVNAYHAPGTVLNGCLHILFPCSRERNRDNETGSERFGDLLKTTLTVKGFDHRLEPRFLALWQLQRGLGHLSEEIPGLPLTKIIPVRSRAHKRFCELLPQGHRSMEESLQARVSFQQILSLPELKANPFKERICGVFSTSPTRDSLSFEDFLDLLSVFSDTATPDIKSHYAFRIFDFDDDGTLNREDLCQLVNCLTGEGEDTRLSASEMKQLIDNILEESDIDRDGTINLSEFQHVISRSPDFVSSFKIVL
ncbi:calcium and integrin-binding protein 1 isoform X2 [Loxodonta africana]|uniref:calcium and integrin-binding protein 1 isoform X2 n=1 Tax=Loxodonta africana TaxID=9785 RepID=UPI0030D0A40A